MKRFYAFAAATVLAAVLLTGCQQKKFTVEGTIENAADATLYLENATLTGTELIDSVVLDADGHFSFSEEAPQAPEFYQLRIERQVINLSIDSTETVTVKAQQPGMATNYTVEGSDNCEKIRQLALKQQQLYREVEKLQSLPNFNEVLQARLNEYKQELTSDYIYKEPQKAYAYFALFQTLGPWLIFNPDDETDKRAFAAVATSWNTFYPESPRSLNLHNIFMKSKERRDIERLRSMQQLDEEKVTESGIIELALTDNKGQVQRLSSLRGRVVLLDFHSFALADSPQRILMLRGLYNKYHEQGLEIYQVSVDADEHFWKQQTAELPWISVRDETTESVMRYNVGSVPEYFTINRESQLQKRSTQIENLEEEIEQLLSFRR